MTPMLQSEKRVKAKHRDKNYYKPPVSTQDLIPVDTVYEDGMFLSNGGLYSMSYRFSDINYTIADQSTQESLIRDMRSINKSCTATEISQITIVNRRINEDLLTALKYQLYDDEYDTFRKELNAILESQIGRGTGIMQERYFTMSVAKSTPKEAKTHFDRVGTEMALRFAGMGSSFTPIELGERLRILRDFYRPGDEDYWNFDLEEKKKKGPQLQGQHCPHERGPGKGPPPNRGPVRQGAGYDGVRQLDR